MLNKTNFQLKTVKLPWLGFGHDFYLESQGLTHADSSKSQRIILKYELQAEIPQQRTPITAGQEHRTPKYKENYNYVKTTSNVPP